MLQVRGSKAGTEQEFTANDDSGNKLFSGRLREAGRERGRLEAAVRDRLTEERYAHVLAVRDCAAKLAELYGVDREKAELAGVLHDYARDLPGEVLLSLAEERGIPFSEIDRKVPILLHGPVGAALVREELGVENPEVLEAIALHTLGGAGMSMLAKIVYVADIIAADRDFPGVNRLRQLAGEDLDRALVECLATTLRYCLERRRLIHPQTITAWNYYCLRD